MSMSRELALKKIEELLFASVTDFEQGEAKGYLEACLNFGIISKEEFEAFCLRI